MLYPFMTLPDETEIVHSESMISDGREYVKVCIEKPVDGGFKTATCRLPEEQWESVSGYNRNELRPLHKLIHDQAEAICVLARTKLSES